MRAFTLVAGLLFSSFFAFAGGFLIFPSREVLKEQYSKFLEKSNHDLKILELDSPKYIQAEKVLNEVYTAMKTDGEPPLFLIIEDSETSYVIGSPEDPRRPYAIMVAGSVVGKNQLYFTLAHELAHLVLQPRGEMKEFRFKKNEDPQAKRIWEEWYNLLRATGLSHHPDLLGAPLTDLFEYEEGLFQQLLGELVKPCKEASEKFLAARESLAAVSISKFTSDFIGSAPGLRQKVSEFKFAAEKCFNKTPPSGTKILRTVAEKIIKGVFKSDEDFLLAANGDSEVSTVVEYFSRLLNVELGKEIRGFAKHLWALTFEMTEKRLNLEAEMKLKDFNIYSAEDFADEEAVKVLVKLKKPIATHFSPQGLNFEEEKLCRQMIKDAKPIPYGSFASSHHSPCWRLKRNLDLEKLLLSNHLR